MLIKCIKRTNKSKDTSTPRFGFVIMIQQSCIVWYLKIVIIYQRSQNKQTMAVCEFPVDLIGCGQDMTTLIYK